MELDQRTLLNNLGRRLPWIVESTDPGPFDMESKPKSTSFPSGSSIERLRIVRRRLRPLSRGCGLKKLPLVRVEGFDALSSDLLQNLIQ